jgi:hypothetical protein
MLQVPVPRRGGELVMLGEPAGARQGRGLEWITLLLEIAGVAGH